MPVLCNSGHVRTMGPWGFALKHENKADLKHFGFSRNYEILQLPCAVWGFPDGKRLPFNTPSEFTPAPTPNPVEAPSERRGRSWSSRPSGRGVRRSMNSALLLSTVFPRERQLWGPYFKEQGAGALRYKSGSMLVVVVASPDGG